MLNMASKVCQIVKNFAFWKGQHYDGVDIKVSNNSQYILFTMVLWCLLVL